MKQNTKKGGIFYSAFNIAKLYVRLHYIIRCMQTLYLFAIPAYDSLIKFLLT